MEVRFVGQPYRDTPCGASVLSETLADPSINRLLVITAWVRQSGVDLIAPDLRALLDRGGEVELFVGVALHGTTLQGLEAVSQLGAKVWVVHDVESGTFHPKLYVATGESNGYALIGSNNLTAGGLSFNYEAALGVSFITTKTPRFVEEAESFRCRLLEDKEICHELTPAFLRRLERDGWLADEVRDRKHPQEDQARRRVGQPSGARPLFGRSKFNKRSRPPVRAERGQASMSGVDQGAAKPSSRRRKLALAPDAWSKQLGSGDAQRSPEGNLTGVVRLTPPREVADRSRFFRRVFFRDEHWRVRRDLHGNRLEVARLKVSARIDRRDLGEAEIEIDYGAYRNVRGRATTVMHWGELMPEVLKQDVTGYYLLIERSRDAYQLTLSPNEPV